MNMLFLVQFAYKLSFAAIWPPFLEANLEYFHPIA